LCLSIVKKATESHLLLEKDKIVSSFRKNLTFNPPLNHSLKNAPLLLETYNAAIIFR